MSLLGSIAYIHIYKFFLGTLIRRHRIPHPPPNDDTFYIVEDFNVGLEVNLYSRVFKITGCDEFTQNFLRKLGVRVNQPVGTPEDPHTKYRKAVSSLLEIFFFTSLIYIF